MSHVLLVAGALVFETAWGQVGPRCVPDRLAHRLTRAQRTCQRRDVRPRLLPAGLGAWVEAGRPQGRHASLWRRLLTEVQMRWHASRVNHEREARRQQAANGLWLHGGGAWRPLEASRFVRVDA